MGEEQMTEPVPSDRRLGPQFDTERKRWGPVEVRGLWQWCKEGRVRRRFEGEEWSSKVAVSQRGQNAK
jgi:hypothetical protein